VLPAGLIAFAVVFGTYLAFLLVHPFGWVIQPVDLQVYYASGHVIRHVPPYYNPHLADPLYGWSAATGHGLLFTYPPFAALLFTVVSFVPWTVLPRLWIAVNILVLVAAVWFTFGLLGYRPGRVRVGATLLATAAVFLAEPVQRDIYLSQINLVLMALILWDLALPDRRWWKGAGVGIAAGIKLVPLIFIPYLLLTRRIRQAAAAGIAFVGTVLAGYIALPAESSHWWLHGLFADTGRVIPFLGKESNQSLRGLITRLAGSMSAGGHMWLVAATLTAILGLGCAVLLARAGHFAVGVLACALTGLLVSPVSWDHHWVWVVPGVAVAGHYAVQAMRAHMPGVGLRAALTWPAAGYWALVVGVCVGYAAWPGAIWGRPYPLGEYGLGFVPGPRFTPLQDIGHGDRPWFYEYHWHGAELLTGNAFVLGGLALLTVLVIASIRVTTLRAAGKPAGAAEPCPPIPRAGTDRGP
jgi:alpha-1,2-mannosyltransferase